MSSRKSIAAPAAVWLVAVLLGGSMAACADVGDRMEPGEDPAPVATDLREEPGAAGGMSEPEVGAVDEVTGGWPTEMYNGEVGAVKNLVLKALAAKEPLPDEFMASVSPDFVGQDLSAVGMEPLGVPGNIEVMRWLEDGAGAGAEAGPEAGSREDLGAEEFALAFERYIGSFAEVLTTEVHTWELQLTEPGEGMEGLEAKEAFWIVGSLPDGRLREDRMLLVFDLERPEGGDADAWRLRRIHAEDGLTNFGPGPQLVDVTAQALPPGYDQVGAEVYTDAGPALADFDGDGAIDLFLPRMHAPPILYRNDGQGRFSDVTAEWGIVGPDLASGSNSGVFFDYDADGRLDLVVGFQAAGLRLYHNEGDKFRDVTGAFPMAGPGFWESLAVADFDGDGLPDIYATNYGLIDTENQPASYVEARDGGRNVLLRNLGDGRFEDVTAAAGMEEESTRWSYAAAWADYDRDGDMDLYVANDYGPNNLFENDGTGAFRDVASERGADDFGNGMSATWFDFDNDADLDLYVSNMQSFAGNRITRLDNFPGTEEERELYRRFSQGSTLLRNDGDDGFTEWSREAGVKAAFWAWGSTAFDYDNDGDQDLFSNAGFYTGPDAADT